MQNPSDVMTSQTTQPESSLQGSGLSKTLSSLEADRAARHAARHASLGKPYFLTCEDVQELKDGFLESIRLRSVGDRTIPFVHERLSNLSHIAVMTTDKLVMRAIDELTTELRKELVPVINLEDPELDCPYIAFLPDSDGPPTIKLLWTEIIGGNTKFSCYVDDADFSQQLKTCAGILGVMGPATRDIYIVEQNDITRVRVVPTSSRSWWEFDLHDGEEEALEIPSEVVVHDQGVPVQETSTGNKTRKPRSFGTALRDVRDKVLGRGR